MVRYLTICICLLYAFTGCKSEKNVENTDKKIVSTITDTIVSLDKGSGLPLNTKLSSRDTLLQIFGDGEYTLSYSAMLDTFKKYRSSDIFTDSGKIHKNIYNGFQAYYNFRLIDNSGKKIFDKVFTKDIFKGILSTDIIVQTEAYLPSFVGYIPTFNAFVFTIDMGLPYTDQGQQCLLMLNKKGEIIQNSYSNALGSGSCDGQVEIPKSQGFIVSCNRIFNSNGKNIDIYTKTSYQVGVKLINEHHILVIQEHDDGTKPEAMIIDNNGNVLRSFNYKGSYQLLSYNVPIKFDANTNNYYLLDEQLKNVRVINKEDPLSTYTIPFGKMESYNNKKSENEIVFENEITGNSYYLNTKTGRIRNHMRG